MLILASDSNTYNFHKNMVSLTIHWVELILILITSLDSAYKTKTFLLCSVSVIRGRPDVLYFSVLLE